MTTLWIVQVSAEAGGRALNVLVSDESRERAEMTAVAAVLSDGWSKVNALRSGIVSEERLAEREDVFREAAVSARDLGWCIVRYRPTI